MQEIKNDGAAPKGYSKGYGKRPLWQWIALYVVVGGVLYFVAYLVFFHGSTAGSSLHY